MEKLQQLKVFVNERLAAAAEEIFGAVERTILEYQSDICLSMKDKHSELLTLAECLRREEEEVFTAVSQEVSLSEAEASSQLLHIEDFQVLVKQDSLGPGFPEPQEHRPSQDEGKLQNLLEGDAVVCLQYKQSTQSSSCCQTQTVASEEGALSQTQTVASEEGDLSQTQTVASEEGDLSPGTLTERMKSEEEADGCAGSDFWQPLSSDSGDGVDTSDDEWTKSGGSKSKKRQRQNSPSLNSEQSTNQRPLCCKWCGESFRYKSLLMRHVKSHADNTTILGPPNHAVSAESGTEPLETHREDDLCYICGKTFTTRSHLKRHMLVHTGQKPHCCKVCGKRFARGECLRIHMRTHAVETPYPCEVCGKGFKQRGNMVCHMRTHTGEKPYRCGICSRSFAYKKDMTRHMQGHAKKM